MQNSREFMGLEIQPGNLCWWITTVLSHKDHQVNSLVPNNFFYFLPSADLISTVNNKLSM